MGDVSIFRRRSSRGQNGVVTRLQQLPNGDDLDQNHQGRPSVNSRVKSVIVGDSCVGKTSLVVSYSTNGYPTEYVPTAFDNYSVLVTVDDKPVHLQICDTGGQEEFTSLRALCYPHTDVFILCFSVICPTSFAHIKEKWLPEIQAYRCNQEPIILVGNQCDLRNDVKTLISLSQHNDRPVSVVQAQTLCRQIGGSAYVECSALTQKNLKEVFDAALLAGLQNCTSEDGSLSPGTGESSNKRANSCCSFVKDKAFNWRKLCCF